MRSRFKRAAILTGVLTLALAGQARAESFLIATIAGNDCSGVFGTGFSNCAIPGTYDPNTSPVIIKFNPDGTVNEVNSALFPTISGSEFSFTFGPGNTGSWNYTPGAGDPATLVSFFVAKGGDAFNLFSVDSNGPNAWFTPANGSDQGAGLSHLTFYEGGTDSVVPEPGTWLLVGSGLMCARRWRKKGSVLSS
jgi:hypothetical protein